MEPSNDPGKLGKWMSKLLYL